MLIRTVIVTSLLAIVSVCFFGSVLHSQSGFLREYQAALLSVQWMLLVCIAVWCGSFIFLTFSMKDSPLIGLLLIAIAAYFIGEAASWRIADAIILLAGVTLGKSAFVLLRRDEGGTAHVIRHSSLITFLVGLVVLPAFSSFWHLDMSNNFYHGPRWMGLWNNPNIYGMLMSVGFVLAVGLLVTKKHKERKGNQENSDSSPRPSPRLARRGWNFLRSLRSFAAIESIILFIAAGMMAVGLLFSYSRGAWLGTAIGLLYLAWLYSKFKWRYVVLGLGLLALGVLLIWGRTPDNAPWYVKRMDFGRASAQHRVAAWKAGFEIMRDHPFGVGWNKTVETYEKNYSPPENGAAAITTNDYLMLGTQLGIPGLLCFVAYVALCLRSLKPKVQPPSLQSSGEPSSPKSAAEAEDGKKEFAHEPARADARPTATLDIGHWTLDSTQAVCRVGALVLLVAFWFDGGLFDLPTASVFWILLELGAVARSGEAKQIAEFSSVHPEICA